MKRFTKFVWLGMALALIAAIVVPLAAQEADPGAGNGGQIVESNIGDDPSTFNPVIGNDATSSEVYSYMYPAIIALDPVTLQPTPMAAGGMAASWEYDATGTVLTISLRQDIFWSDGTPITSADYMWSVNATKSGLTSSPRTSAFYRLDDGTVIGGVIHEVTAPDEFTVVVRLGNVQLDEAGAAVLDADGKEVLIPNCDAINSVNDVTPVPAHIYGPAFDGNLGGMDDDPYFLPQGEEGPATFGIFTDPFIEFGVQVSLLANQDYPDTQLGYVAPSEWILQQVEDTTVEYERFLAGDFTTIAISPDLQNEFRTLEGFQTIEYPSNGYTFMGYNLADPSNPQSGRDETGALVDQGIHPIFGDVRVRIAIAHAVNVLEMIGTRPEGENPATGILAGNGFPIAVHNHPGLSSVDPGVAPREFNPELAMSMLEEAGWVDGDGNGVRECTGCLYATTVDAAYEGTEMSFELLTNAGNRLREAAGETIRAQLAEVGITVNFQAIEFGTLVDEFLSQQGDAIIIGWNLGLPFAAGESITGLFGAGNDIPGGGFNTTSYANQEMEDLINAADSLPAAEDGSYGACDETVRNEMYAEAMRLMYENPPYLWLYAGNVMVAAQGSVENFDPLPYSPSWNIDAWTVTD
jgi:peptide/nickel transport system substrate-binding protein